MDNDSPLDLIYTRRCPSNQQCIVIREGSIPGVNIGTTNMMTIEEDIDSASVKLQTSWGKRAPYRQRLALTCHEMGHAVGLDHRNTTRSCMFWAIGIGVSWHLDGTDRALLRKAY
jgi:hypothetical protein